MAIDYTKTNWVNGITPVTAQHLNNLENGIYSLDQLFPNNAGAHNSIYRGNYLGSSVTSTQWASIKAGTFEDLYIGDYWTINSVNWRIAAFDYYLGVGDTPTTDHHVVIVPDTVLCTTAFSDDTHPISGGYIGSLAREKVQALTTHTDAFGSEHILTHRVMFLNATSSSAWVDSTIDLMRPTMISDNWRVYNTQFTSATLTANSVLPLFTYKPANFEGWNWTADVYNGSVPIIMINGMWGSYPPSYDYFNCTAHFCIYQA